MKVLYNDGHVAEIEKEEELQVIRHTAAHIMAQAILRLHPQAKFAYGPATERGFYYDVDLGEEKLTDEDLAAIEAEMKKAVQAGYWHLYRYDPKKEKPFQLDSSAPKLPLRDFLDGEVRYSSLALRYPENADALFAQAEEQAKEKYDRYRRMDEQA